jgi:hypothetical protein
MRHLLLAEFDTVQAMNHAAGEAAEKGYPARDALSPFPVPEIMRHLSYRRKPAMGWPMAVAGAIGAGIMWFVEWFSASRDYPIISGARPFNSWQIFFIVTVEACILCAGVGGFIAFILDCRFPALHHPLFDLAAIERASQERFFLIFEAREDLRDKVAEMVSQLHPLSVTELAA